MSEISNQEMMESAGLDNPPSAQGLKRGDMVVMHSCLESEYHYGQIWECETDSATFFGVTGEHVNLIGFTKPFPVRKLQLIKREEIKRINILI